MNPSAISMEGCRVPPPSGANTTDTPKIAGFAVDHLSITYAVNSQSKIKRLDHLKSLPISDKIALSQERSPHGYYRGPCFAGHGFRLFSGGISKRPLQLIIHGEACTNHRGKGKLAEVIQAIEEALGATDPIVSRCDLALDLAHWSIDLKDLKSFWSSLKKIQTFTQNSKTPLEGIIFGTRGSNQVRIYNKAAELKKSDLNPSSLYPDLAPTDSLWRIEPSLRHDYLRRFQINTPEEAILNAPALMKSVMTETICQHGPNGQASRQWISWRDQLCKAPPLQRIIVQPTFNESHLNKMIVGILSTIAIQNGLCTVDEAIERLSKWPNLNYSWKKSYNKKRQDGLCD